MEVSLLGVNACFWRSTKTMDENKPTAWQPNCAVSSLPNP